MMTPTLFDIAAITGLPPTGDAYDPSRVCNTIDFGFNSKTYSKYIAENQKDDAEVGDEEHVAFLTLWLSQHVFCKLQDVSLSWLTRSTKGDSLDLHVSFLGVFTNLLGQLVKT
jgi:hypothetical protein